MSLSMSTLSGAFNVNTSHELSSFDSSKNPSTEITQTAQKQKGDIIKYKSHTNVLIKVIYVLSFALTMFSIFYPWTSMRSSALKIFNELILNKTVSQTIPLSKIVGDHFDKYRMTSNFLSALFEPASLIEMTDQYVYQFIKFAKSTHSTYVLKPMTLFINKPDDIFYEVFFPSTNTSDFELYAQFKENGTTIKKKYLANYEHFLTFNHLEDGETVLTIPGSPLLLDLKSKKWINSISQYKDSIKAIIYAVETAYPDLDVGLSLNIETLMTVFKSGISSRFTKFAFMTLNGGVLFDSDIGVVSPIFDKSGLDFPQLDQLGSDFWTHVSKLNFSKGFYQEVEFSESTYFVSLCNVTSAGEVTHFFLFVIEKDALLTKPLMISALEFLVLLVACLILIFVMNYCRIKNDEKLTSRLNRRENFLIPENDGVDSCSTLKHCISQIRTIELLYPEDIILNQVLDKVVADISEYRYRQYITRKKANCGFCQYMTTNPIKTEFKSEECFNSWHSMTSHAFKSGVPMVFNLDECLSNPQQYLMKTFMKLILDQKLTFEIFDPDMFLQFLFNFSISLCSDCTMASFILYQLHYFLRKYFSTWINSKFDFLIIYFTAMIYYSDSSSLEEELMLDEESCIQIMALNDNYSKSIRKFSFILDVFAEYFEHIEEQKMFTYFRSSVAFVLLEIQDFRLFDLFGMFRVRIESPEFSVFNDDNDKLLFFSALIKFSQFSIYYQDLDSMKSLAHIYAAKIFDNTEMQNRLLLSEFHYEQSSKFALYWLKCFTNFTVMPYESEKLEKTIHYWEVEKSTMFHDVA